MAKSKGPIQKCGSKGVILQGTREVAYGRVYPWRSTAQVPSLLSNFPHSTMTHPLIISNCALGWLAAEIKISKTFYLLPRS